jgi:hypothetical protein
MEPTRESAAKLWQLPRPIVLPGDNRARRAIGDSPPRTAQPGEVRGGAMACPVWARCPSGASRSGTRDAGMAGGTAPSLYPVPSEREGLPLRPKQGERTRRRTFSLVSMGDQTTGANRCRTVLTLGRVSLILLALE